jgi:hypothetical protein
LRTSEVFRAGRFAGFDLEYFKANLTVFLMSFSGVFFNIAGGMTGTQHKLGNNSRANRHHYGRIFSLS